MPHGGKPLIAMLLGFFLLAQTGCGTLANLAEGPVVYGGIRHNGKPRDLNPAFIFIALDYPFSAVLDTALLPITGLFELIRWQTGWPPHPDFKEFQYTWP